MPRHGIFVGQSAICAQTNRNKHTSCLHELRERCTSLELRQGAHTSRWMRQAGSLESLLWLDRTLNRGLAPAASAATQQSQVEVQLREELRVRLLTGHRVQAQLELLVEEPVHGCPGAKARLAGAGRAQVVGPLDPDQTLVDELTGRHEVQALNHL